MKYRLSQFQVVWWIWFNGIAFEAFQATYTADYNQRHIWTQYVADGIPIYFDFQCSLDSSHGPIFRLFWNQCNPARRGLGIISTHYGGCSSTHPQPVPDQGCIIELAGFPYISIHHLVSIGNGLRCTNLHRFEVDKWIVGHGVRMILIPCIQVWTSSGSCVRSVNLLLSKKILFFQCYDI